MSDSDTDSLGALRSLPVPQVRPMSDALERELAMLAPVATRRPTRQLVIVASISLIYACGLVAVLSVRRDVAELPPVWFVSSTILRLLGFLTLCYLALTPRRGTMVHRWKPAAVLVIAVAITFVAFGLLFHPSGPSSLYYGWPRFYRGHHCIEIALAVSALPVGLCIVFLRGAVPVKARWILAAAGAAAGCLGGIVLSFYCRVADGLHVGLIHGGVIAVSATLTALLGHRAG